MFKKIEKYSLGIGDRFALRGKDQLRALMLARDNGILVAPVWNKSNREHTIIGSLPGDVLLKANEAVRLLQWNGPFHIDADHINLANVDRFVEFCDFFTIDVADYIGKTASRDEIGQFVIQHRKFLGQLTLPGLPAPFLVTETALQEAAAKFLLAIQEAGKVYRHICHKRGNDEFITEVSVDEAEEAQTPVELLLILSMLANEGVPVQTVAPKFTGCFNKGVDYAGDLEQFAKEFDADLRVVSFAVREFDLPETLKLSIHSGSDKFAIYPIVNRLIHENSAGLHVKTAGTTWLEEVIGLGESGGEGLRIAQEIYVEALKRFEELTKPYATVVDIDRSRLPDAGEVMSWSSQKFVETLRHEQSCPGYNRHFRQLMHVSFKVAAEMGERFKRELANAEEIIGRNVTDNLYSRHIRPIFFGSGPR